MNRYIVDIVCVFCGKIIPEDEEVIAVYDEDSEDYDDCCEDCYNALSSKELND